MAQQKGSIQQGRIIILNMYTPIKQAQNMYTAKN